MRKTQHETLVCVLEHLQLFNAHVGSFPPKWGDPNQPIYLRSKDLIEKLKVITAEEEEKQRAKEGQWLINNEEEKRKTDEKIAKEYQKKHPEWDGKGPGPDFDERPPNALRQRFMTYD
ncbi:hypothetical protein M7I_2840 [Glarea lozoyensis 74030]|nr:hypothetical protein M7I_2840 [Glarea lozoyensis 74030]